MIDRLQMVLKPRAANREAVLNDLGSPAQSQPVAFDGIGRVAQFAVLVFSQIGERNSQQRPQLAGPSWSRCWEALFACAEPITRQRTSKPQSKIPRALAKTSANILGVSLPVLVL